MQALSISIATLALAAGLATPLSAQTAAGPDAPKKALTPMKVQSPHPSAKRIAAAGQAGKQAAAGKHLTAGYQENDINAAPFGSQHWWRVQGWQAGGSSSQP